MELGSTEERQEGGGEEEEEKDNNGKIMSGKKGGATEGFMEVYGVFKSILLEGRATHLPTDKTTHMHGWTVV
jgi:hypothetical protein